METEKKIATKPDCYKCVHRRKIHGDAHTRCNNFDAKTEGHPQGIRRGWFILTKG